MKVAVLLTAIVVAEANIKTYCGIRSPGRSKYLESDSLVSNPREFPWQASLQDPLSRDQQLAFWAGKTPRMSLSDDELPSVYRRHLCNAVIINDRWVMAPFSCFDSQRQWYSDGFSIMVGPVARCVAAQTDPLRRSNEYRICRSTKWPTRQYGPASPEDRLPIDVVLIKIYGSFDDEVTPICMPGPEWRTQFPPNTKCLITSWNTMSHGEFDNLPSAVAHRENFIVGTREYCDEHKPPFYIESELICTDIRNKSYPTACDEDRGSPLTCQLDGRHYMIGMLVSPGCGQYPNYFENVAYYMKWIRLAVEERLDESSFSE